MKGVLLEYVYTKSQFLIFIAGMHMKEYRTAIGTTSHVRGDFRPESRIKQHFKDLEIALSYAKKLRQSLPLTQVHRKILKEAIDAGDGDLDNAAVIQHIRRMANRDQDR